MCAPFERSALFWHLWHLWHWVPTLTATQPTSQPPTLASPIQGDFLSKHTSAADCECELGIGWRGIWGDLADCAQASLFSRKSTRFKFPGPLMLLHPLICGHTKGNFISEGLKELGNRQFHLNVQVHLFQSRALPVVVRHIPLPPLCELQSCRARLLATFPSASTCFSTQV